MLTTLRRSLFVTSTVVLAALLIGPRCVAASQVKHDAKKTEHAVAGEVKRVDHATKTVVVHTAEGTDETIKFTDRTVVHGAEDAGKATGKAADKAGIGSLEGGMVVVRYVGEGADKTAVRVDRVGKDSLKMVKGTVVRTDEGGKYVVVKTEKGADETFDLGKDAVVDSGKGIADAADATGHAFEKGAKVTVHYTDDAGKKVGHLFKRM